jgi:tRNA threonylcarbamoyladenosine biosynthesis protein TsaB
MRVLALETSSPLASVALWIDGRCREVARADARGHSEHLLAMVDDVLAEAELGVEAIDGIACGIGPGAFTGVRIAVSVAQGLAFARDLPFAPVVSLEALAEGAGAPRVYACIDARMGEVYAAAYERAGDRWRAVVAPCIAPLAAPPDPPMPAGAWTGAGSGLMVLPGVARERLALRDSRTDALPRAGAVATLGAALLARGEGIDPAAAAPLYLRDKVALDLREQAARRAARAA